MHSEPQPPASHADLLERPLTAHLATVRPDGSPQSNVMWFDWDGRRIRMTHTKSRQKYRNLGREPRVALSVSDPDDPYRFLEKRYGQEYEIPDAPERVVVTIRPERYVAVTGGSVTR